MLAFQVYPTSTHIISSIEELNRHQPLPTISFVRPYILCWPHQPAFDGSNIPTNITMANNLPKIPIDIQIMMFIRQLQSLINCFKTAYIQTKFLSSAILRMNSMSRSDRDNFFTMLQTLMVEMQSRTTELLQNYSQHVNSRTTALAELRRDCGAFANSQEFVAH